MLRLLLYTPLLLLVAACTGMAPGELQIDRSIQARSQDSRVEIIVLHYTATGNDASIKILSEHNVSSHYLITDERRPVVYQLVDENRRAWHAGVSEWYGRTDINAGSIGIELVNDGGSGTDRAPYSEWAPYSDAQIDTLIALLHDIVERHRIKPHNIVGHSDIAPQRKVDPGPMFPWKRLAEAGLGRWYDDAERQRYLRDFQTQGAPGIQWVQRRLKRAGYPVEQHGILDDATRNVIAAFQMRYRPTLYNGIPDLETMAILKALH